MLILIEAPHFASVGIYLARLPAEGLKSAGICRRSWHTLILWAIIRLHLREKLLDGVDDAYNGTANNDGTLLSPYNDLLRVGGRLQELLEIARERECKGYLVYVSANEIPTGNPASGRAQAFERIQELGLSICLLVPRLIWIANYATSAYWITALDRWIAITIVLVNVDGKPRSDRIGSPDRRVRTRTDSNSANQSAARCSTGPGS